MAPRYLLQMLAGAVGAMLLVAGFNWLMDPLAIYGSPRIEGLNAVKPALETRSRIFKTLQATGGGWEALIVGTSRADIAIDPAHPFFAGLRGFNAAIVGQSLGEALAIVQGAAASGRLRRVLAVLDFEVANAHYEGAPDYSPENFRPWRRWALAFSTRTAWLAVNMPLHQDRTALAHDASWLPNGRFIFRTPSKGHRAATRVSELDYIENNFFRGPRREFGLSTASLQTLEPIRDMLRFAHAKRIDLVLAMSPVHARQVEVIAQLGLGHHWEQWKRSLAAINDEEARRAGRSPFALWDFSGYNEVTTEPFPPGDHGAMRWYFESSHYTPATGALMLDRMMGNETGGFGRLITVGNIEQHLVAERRARSAWRAANPQEVAEVALLARTYAPANRMGTRELPPT